MVRERDGIDEESFEEEKEQPIPRESIINGEEERR